MTKEELKKYLTDNLTVLITKDWSSSDTSSYDTVEITIAIKLEGKTISTDSFCVKS